MKVPISWLNEYVDVSDLSIKELADKLTFSGVEVDFSCHVCAGKGCRVCKMSGWIEIAGAGMVDPRVFQFVGYDPEKVFGYAFGFGVERIAMIKYGIPDIRWLYENDTRFLSQLA